MFDEVEEEETKEVEVKEEEIKKEETKNEENEIFIKKNYNDPTAAFFYSLGVSLMHLTFILASVIVA